MKKFIKFLLSFFILIIGSLVYILTKTEDYNVELNIRDDVSLKTSLLPLEKQSPLIFKLYLKYRKGGKNVKAGIYEFKGRYNIMEIFDVLENGREKVLKLTIPEGYTVEQVAEMLENTGRFSKAKFYEELKKARNSFPYLTPNGNFEGYLYPETYFVRLESSENEVVKMILSEFLKQFPSDKYPDKKEFYKKLIMASILEREAIVSDEKPLIASVFYNRLKKGMTLSSDATVNFVYNYKKKLIYYKDLEIKSPYNTYKHKGLPPAPICNPDKKSILASYKPQDSDYLFFVAMGDGRHFFSKTYKEHLEFQQNKILIK